jgi:hypothetical protein
MAFGAMRCFVGLMPVLVVQFNHRTKRVGLMIYLSIGKIGGGYI